MDLKFYSPTFRNVLLLEVTQKKTDGGIYIPSSDFLSPDQKVYTVIKTGKDCIEVKTGDTVRVMEGIRLEKIPLKGTETYLQIPEQQIIGYYRDESIRNAPGSKSKTPGSSKLQKR